MVESSNSLRRPPHPDDASQAKQSGCFGIIFAICLGLLIVAFLIALAMIWLGAVIVIVAGIVLLVLQYALWGWWLPRMMREEIEREDQEERDDA